MSLKPKTSRRLLALGGIVLLLALGAGGALAYRSVRKKNELANFRTQGMALFEKQEYYDALDQLGRFLKRNSEDREVLLAYAESRENIEEPDGGHLREAITIYQKALTKQPSDTKTARHLLELFQVSLYHPEARDLAKRLRPDDLAQCTMEHFDLLRAEANSRMAINGSDPEVTKLLARMLELAPNDFPAQVVLVEQSLAATTRALMSTPKPSARSAISRASIPKPPASRAKSRSVRPSKCSAPPASLTA
jgi:tetratricopeptide (TPR) repeat protein